MNHVLILSHDVVGTKMAGPGIRYWELAHVLAREFRVTLLVPGSTSLSSEEFDLRCYPAGQPELLAREAEQADVVLAYGFAVGQWPFLTGLPVPWIADVYVPELTEVLGWYPGKPLARREERFSATYQVVESLARGADLYLCANEAQRDFWLGVLAAHGRLNPTRYDQDPTFQTLVAIVPCGLPSTPPQPGRPALKGVHAGIARGDQVVLWGGGLWDWLDPLTLVRAMARLVKVLPATRLVFPGTRHPNLEQVPDMAVRQQTLDLVRELNLESHVLLGEWLPYAERESWLLEADAGVSLHTSSIESRYAFRTRLLDYVWAGLPMVVSSGDPLSELVAAHNLGIVVAPGDEEQVFQALLALLSDPCARSSREGGFAQVQALFAWKQVAQPLIRFCRQPRIAAGKAPGEAASLESVELAREIEAQSEEIGRLREQIGAYERGRFIRFMSRLAGLRQKARELIG